MMRSRSLKDISLWDVSIIVCLKNGVRLIQDAVNMESVGGKYYSKEVLQSFFHSLENLSGDGRRSFNVCRRLVRYWLMYKITLYR